MTIKASFHIRRGDFLLQAEFTAPAQGVTAIYGPSGCGKSTLLRAIAGLERSENGYLRVKDSVWQEKAYFVPTHKRSLGYVFQEASLLSHLSVRSNLEYGIRRVPPTERRITLERAIGLLGIEGLLERRSHQLSGGERQRVAIARALALSPQILLLDEPLAALDLPRRLEIMPYLESLRDELNIPLIYVSHAPDEVARLADHLVLLEAGRVKASGEIAEMLTRLDLPLALGDDAEALIAARVIGHDEEFALTYLAFSGGRFTAARNNLPVGHRVRVRVTARDVSLTREHQKGTSILNIFPAQVDSLLPLGETQVMVRLLLGEAIMLSRITRKSAQILEICPGKRVYAQVKSIALLQ